MQYVSIYIASLKENKVIPIYHVCTDLVLFRALEQLVLTNLKQNEQYKFPRIS